MHKKLIRLAPLAALIGFTHGALAADVAGNVALATDYKFRGVTQTDNQAAIQGGFDYAHESGIYVGTWGSNVDSTFFGGARDPQMELDVYGGYKATYNDIGYDLGVIRYTYPGGSFFNTTEFKLGLSYDIVSVAAFYGPKMKFLGVDKDGWYFSGDIADEVTKGITLGAHVGVSTGDAFDGNGALPDSYTDYAVSVSGAVAGVTVKLAWIGTDSNGEDNFGDLADDSAVLSVSKAF